MSRLRRSPRRIVTTIICMVLAVATLTVVSATSALTTQGPSAVGAVPVCTSDGAGGCTATLPCNKAPCPSVDVAPGPVGWTTDSSCSCGPATSLPGAACGSRSARTIPLRPTPPAWSVTGRRSSGGRCRLRSLSTRPVPTSPRSPIPRSSTNRGRETFRSHRTTSPTCMVWVRVSTATTRQISARCSSPRRRAREARWAMVPRSPRTTPRSSR